jgi:hypothetical protein
LRKRQSAARNRRANDGGTALSIGGNGFRAGGGLPLIIPGNGKTFFRGGNLPTAMPANTLIYREIAEKPNK